MKLNVFAPVLLAASGLAFAQAPASAPEGDKAGKSVTHKYKVEVVSTDATAKTITVVRATGKPESKPTTGGTTPSGEKGAEVTLKVDESAAAALAGLRPGEKVTLTCRTAIGPEAGMAPGSTSAPGSTASKEGGSTRGLQQCDMVTKISKY
jgi:hypothetical protein